MRLKNRISEKFCRVFLKWRYSRFACRQNGASECASAAFVSLASYHGVRVPLYELRAVMGTGSDGTTLYGMSEAFRHYGFETACIRSCFSEGVFDASPLTEIPLPVIVHVKTGSGMHYMTVFSVDERGLLVMDPAPGSFLWMKMEEFLKVWTGVMLVAVPGKAEMPNDAGQGFLQRLWILVFPHRKRMLQAFIASVIYTVFGLGQSIYLQKIVDYVLPDANGNLANLLSCGILVLLVYVVAVGYVKNRIMLGTGAALDISLTMAYYRHLLKLPQQFFDSMRKGEILSRFSDISNMTAFVNDVMLSFFVNVCIVVFSLLLMFTFYWKLGLVLLLSFPFYAALYILYNYLNSRTQKAVMEQAANVQSHFVETVSSVRTVKEFSMMRTFERKAESLFVDYARKCFRSMNNMVGTSVVSEFLSRFFSIIILWCGSFFVMDRSMTPGELLSFYALISYFISPVGSLVGINRKYQDAKAASERVFAVMDIPEEDEGSVVPDRNGMGNIEFVDVSFRYPGRAPLFESISFKVKAGSYVAFAGESGCGKSTVISLLMKHYRPDSGRIMVGGYDLSSVSSWFLRNNAALVSQNVELFNGTIVYNMSLEEKPDMKLVSEIVSRLDMDDFISGFERGLETEIGENGIRLSGGQRQKLAFARALYRKPSLLIMDEATSYMDNVSEKRVMQTAQEYAREGNTLIVIAHRLSGISAADVIHVIADGMVVASGSHESLLCWDNPYSRMWNLQKECVM